MNIQAQLLDKIERDLINDPIFYEFRITYRHRVTEHFDHRVITVGQEIPEIGPNWDIIGTDLFTGLKDSSGRKVFAGDVYRFLRLVFPITVSFEHGLCFMFGKDQINMDIVRYGHFLGTIYENLDYCTKSTTGA